MRAKRKIELKQRFELGTLGGLMAVLIGGILFTGVFRNDGWVPRFVHRHTPQVQFQAPDTLRGLPLLGEIPPKGFELWFPGFTWRLRQRWLRAYQAVGHVRFEKHFLENRIAVRLEPRVPLVRWKDQGMDQEGILFPLLSPQWAALPKAVFVPTQPLPAAGRWLADLARVPELWSQVLAVMQDQRGQIWLDMQTGTHVAWGSLEPARVREKARCLALVLEDAHRRLGGASFADVRFFEDGRVIVRPKSAV